MSKYKKLLLLKKKDEQRKKEATCKLKGHKMIKRTDAWAPLPYSQEPYEIEFCERCGYGIPAFA